MEKVLTWEIVKSDWDEWVGRPVTDEEFEAICDEISGRLDNFAEELTQDLIKMVQSDTLLFKSKIKEKEA